MRARSLQIQIDEIIGESFGDPGNSDREFRYYGRANQPAITLLKTRTSAFKMIRSLFKGKPGRIVTFIPLAPFCIA